MRFIKIFTFALMLFFSCCLVSQVVEAQTNESARQVSLDVNVSQGNLNLPADEVARRGFLTTGQAAALGATATGILLMTGVGAPIAVLTGIATAVLTRERAVCSYGEIINAFYSFNHGSWLSPVFNMLFNSINGLAVAVNSGPLSDWVVRILALMMAFYLLYVATKYIVSFTPIEPAKMLSEIFFPLGRMTIAVILIRQWSWVFHDVLSPILELGINFGSEIMNTMGNSTVSYTASVTDGVQVVSATCTETNPGQGLDINLCNSIQTFLATISHCLMTWMAFGVTLIKDCWTQGVGNVFPSFKMLILGLVFFVFTFMVYLAFPLKLIDAMFRLMFIVVLFPLWCLFWVIPQTRDYFKKMISLLINVMATFLSASVVMVMVLAILSNLFDAIPLQRIIELLMEDHADQAMNLLGFSTSGFFYSICLLFMAFHLVGKVDYFANLFAKQDSMGIGSALGAKTTAAVTAGVPMAWGMGKNATKWGAGKVKGAWEKHKAKDYNANVPGGTARKSPRLWTAAIPGMGLWDAHQAKKQIGGYQRTTDVHATPLEKAKDGSTSQTYSNKTVDKQGTVKAQMSETTTSSGNKVKVGDKMVSAKQSVERNVARFDNLGDRTTTANVKKDFENGKAVRKTTVKKNSDGSRTELSVDAKTGLATKTRFSADNKKLSSESFTAQVDSKTGKLKFGERTTQNFDENGHVKNEVTQHKNGSQTTTTYHDPARGNLGDWTSFTKNKDGTSEVVRKTGNGANWEKTRTIRDKEGLDQVSIKTDSQLNTTTRNLIYTDDGKGNKPLTGWNGETRDKDNKLTERFKVDLVSKTKTIFDLADPKKIVKVEAWTDK